MNNKYRVFKSMRELTDLISMNGKSMQEWLDNFEFLAHCNWQPFGVEVK